MRDIDHPGRHALVRVGRPVKVSVGTPTLDARWPTPDSLPMNQPHSWMNAATSTRAGDCWMARPASVRQAHSARSWGPG